MMTQSKRELSSQIDELQETTAVDSDAEAYALLVAAACGDERAAERWDSVDEQRRNRVTETADRT